MITEIAQIEIKPGTEKDYEAAVAKAADLPPIKGFHGFELHRSIEKPQRYRFIARWDTVEAHNDFRASEAFADWRALVGPYYAGPPEVVEHTETVVSTF
ncbi:antibiotic biosynthesis monooxygenase [Bradyrhizobium sp. AUGA SZCCT0169]|jgi:heme-degrading monooxygenase HmoA|uniref:antibiotic biosynthesis monooxygenase family protein n=1 Tax=Bradyrhizobium sp. AUGA SZCCT0169 TaxID=2807663 RepID=UPI001BA71670|nr:antibiotic biosynthesis monooxygenase family protein [Bradyrhizobium sp. AUGA SZCCT0169]MBR1251307.1 antibiotic biosynthesis monooxygenase [Bradyrhizobium sp. AUGA SZCCT0169]